jgi:hypothetical protein
MSDQAISKLQKGLSEPKKLAPPIALGDLRAFVLSDDTLDLNQ